MSGIIEFSKHKFEKIKLVQPDGFKIDLVNRFNECLESYRNVSYQISFWLSDTPCTKDEMLEEYIRKMFGDISAKYESNDYSYSEYTHCTDYDTILKIGNHDLLNELIDKQGKFIIFEINIFETITNIKK